MQRILLKSKQYILCFQLVYVKGGVGQKGCMALKNYIFLTVLRNLNNNQMVNAISGISAPNTMLESRHMGTVRHPV